MGIEFQSFRIKRVIETDCHGFTTSTYFLTIPPFINVFNTT